MGAQRCCCLILFVAAALILRLEARVTRYGTKDFEKLLNDLETWDPEADYTQGFSFALMELWWTPARGFLTSASACHNLRERLSTDGRVTVIECAALRHHNDDSRALLASTEVTSPQAVAQMLAATFDPLEASVIVKVHGESYAMLKLTTVSSCLDFYRIFSLDFQLSLEMLQTVNAVAASQGTSGRPWDLMLDSNSSAVFLHCRAQRSDGRDCDAGRPAGDLLGRWRRQAGGGSGSGSGSGSSGSPGDGSGSSGGGSSGGGTGDGSSGGGSSGGTGSGPSGGGPSGGGTGSGSSGGGSSGGTGSGPSGGGPPGGGTGDGSSGGGGPSGGGAGSGSSGGGPPDGGTGSGPSGGGSSGGGTGSGSSGGGSSGGGPPGGGTGDGSSGGGPSGGAPGDQGGSGSGPPPSIDPSTMPATTARPVTPVGHTFNCPYLSAITRRKFTFLLSVSDLGGKAELDALSNDQVVGSLDGLLRGAFNASSHTVSGLYSPFVNRILIGSNQLVLFISFEKDQQLKPGHSSAVFVLPANFLTAVAAVWRIDVDRSSFSSIDVKMPVRDICDIYEEILTCPYILENKERIKLQATIDLSPFFSRDLLKDRERLNNSVEVLVHHLLENGNHYHTRHHPNNVFELEVMGQRVMVFAQLDLWITTRQERHPNSTELTAQFLHNLDHYMETHSPGDVFFLRVGDVEITVLPLIVSCMDYLQEVPYPDRKYFSYSANLRLLKAQAHLRETSVYFTSLCETSLLHRLPFLTVDSDQPAVPNEYQNMVLLSNRSFTPDRDDATLDLRSLFRVNSGQSRGVIQAAFGHFLRRDQGFHRWLGTVDDSVDVRVDEKPIFRTVRYKYKNYYGESKRLLVTKLRYVGYNKRLCNSWFSQQIIQKAYYYTSRTYFTVDRERDFELDQMNEEKCKSQDMMEFTAVYTLSTLADPSYAWKRDLLERELLEGLKFIFPDMEVTVLQTSINPANVKFDRLRRRVQHQVSLSLFPAAGGSRPKSEAWVRSYAAAGLRLWLATGYLQAKEDDRIFSIEGSIGVSDIMTDDTGVAFKASYILKCSREATWSNDRLERVFRDGFVSREYRLDAMQIRLNRVAERPLLIVKSAEGCQDTGLNATLVYHKDALILSKEDLRYWAAKNDTALRQDVAELIRRSYQYGDRARLRASGFRITSAESVEGATYLNLDAQIVDNQLQFRTQYTLETANNASATELAPDNALEKFRTGLLRLASSLRVQGPVPHHLGCDDCALEAACQPRIDEMQRRAYSVRRLIHLVSVRVSRRVTSAAADSVPLRELLSHWFRVLYLDYFLDSLRLDNQPPIYAYVPYDSAIPIVIDEDRKQVRLSYILIRDSVQIDTTFKSRLFWREEEFTRSFLEAFRAFNDVTGLFATDPEPQTDIEFYPLLPPQRPVLVVSPVEKDIILNVQDVAPAKCTDAIFRERLLSLSPAVYRIPRDANVDTVQDGGNCLVRFRVSAANPADVDSNTWTHAQLRLHFVAALTGELARFSVATVARTAECVYCDARRRVFVNIQAEYTAVGQFAGVEFLTVQNYAEKRRHLIEDHLVPAFDPARRNNLYMGRRRYQLESLETAQFDFRKVGERERYSVVFDASIVPGDASWSEYHLRKLLTGWMASQNALGRDVTLSNITVHILDPVEMSEFIPPPRSDVYTAMVNMTVPLYTSGSGDTQQMLIDAFNSDTQIFTLGADIAAMDQINQTLEDGSQVTLAPYENCRAQMRVQLPQLLTRSAVIRRLQTGFDQLPRGGARDTTEIDFTKMEVRIFYNSTALAKTDCSQTSRRVKFLFMLNLLNTPGNRAITNVSINRNFTHRSEMVGGIMKLVEHNVLDYYGLDISITGDNAIELMYRSTESNGVIQVDYNLLSSIPGFRWIKFVQDTHDILNRINMRTSYDGHRYHDVMKKIGYVQFRGVPTTHVYDRCSYSPRFQVLQNTRLDIIDRDLFQRLGYYLNPSAAVQSLINLIFSLKLSGTQIYSVLPNSTVVHRQDLKSDTELHFTVSYTVISGQRFNIAEYILDFFIKQALNRISDAYGLVVNYNAVGTLDMKLDGVHCIAKMITVGENITTERVGCFPVLDPSLTVGVCAKTNPLIARQVPVKHNFVLLVQSDFVYGDIFPRNDPEARAVIEFMLALVFDDRITPGILLTWDPTFSGQTSMGVSLTNEGLRLTVETFYIVLKSVNATGMTVTAGMVEGIFSANIGKVLNYLGTGSIQQSVIQIWSPDCSHPGGDSNSSPYPVAPTPPPGVTRAPPDYMGQTGNVRVRLAVSMYRSYEITSLIAEESYAKYTFSKWVRQVFGVLPAFNLRNPAYSNLLTAIGVDNADPTRTSLVFSDLLVDLGQVRTSPQALVDAFTEAAISRGSRFIVPSGVLTNLQVSAIFLGDSIRLRRRRRRAAGDFGSPGPIACPFTGGKDFYNQVRITISLLPHYRHWFTNENRIKPVLTYLMKRSLVEALNSAGLSESPAQPQVNLAYVSATSRGVAVEASIPAICTGPGGADELRRRIYASWPSHSVAGRLLQERLVGLSWRRAPGDATAAGWRLRVYKSLLLDHWPWSDSFADRRSLQRLRLTAKLLGILHLVYNDTAKIRLRGFDYDVQQTSAGVRVLLFEDLELLRAALPAPTPVGDLRTLEGAVRAANVRREAEIRTVTPLLLSPFNLTDQFLRVLHLEAVDAADIQQQQPQPQTKTLMVTLHLSAVEVANVSDLEWIERVESALAQKPGLTVQQTRQQPYVRVFRETFASGQPVPLLPSLTVLVSIQCNSSYSEMNACKDDAKTALMKVGATKAGANVSITDTEFLFADIALHVSPPPKSPATFIVSHTAIDETDEDAQQLPESAGSRLAEFWNSMLIHIVHSELHTAGVSSEKPGSRLTVVGTNLISFNYCIAMLSQGSHQWSPDSVRQYISDRFDLWNLLFPYSNIRSTAIDVQQSSAGDRWPTIAPTPLASTAKPTDAPTASVSSAKLTTVAASTTAKSPVQTTPEPTTVSMETTLTAVTSTTAPAVPSTTAPALSTTTSVEPQVPPLPIVTKLRVRHLGILEIRGQFKNWNSSGTDAASVAATESLKETIRESYHFGSMLYPYRLQVQEDNLSFRGESDATFLQFTSEYTVGASRQVSEAEVQKAFSTGWDQRKLKTLLNQAVLTSIQVVPTVEAADYRSSVIVYVFTWLVTDANPSSAELIKLVQRKLSGMYQQTQLVKLNHLTLQLAQSSNRSVLSAKLLLDLEANPRGHPVSDIVSFETHAALKRARGPELNLAEGFFAQVMHSASYDTRVLVKSTPVVLRVRISQSDFMFDPKNRLLIPLLEYHMTKKLEIAFESKRDFSSLGVTVYSVDKLAGDQYAVSSVARVGLLNARQDHDLLALLTEIRSAYEVIHLNWPMNSFSTLSGPVIRVVKLEHRLQMSGASFTGDPDAGGAQFSREFTLNFACNCIGFIYSFDTPSNVTDCDGELTQGIDKDSMGLQLSYTVSFSTGESSLFDLATLGRIFAAGLSMYNAEFAGGHPMRSIGLAIVASHDLSRTRASRLDLDDEPPILVTPQAAMELLLLATRQRLQPPTQLESDAGDTAGQPATSEDDAATDAVADAPANPAIALTYAVSIGTAAAVALLTIAICAACLASRLRRQTLTTAASTDDNRKYGDVQHRQNQSKRLRRTDCGSASPLLS